MGPHPARAGVFHRHWRGSCTDPLCFLQIYDMAGYKEFRDKHGVRGPGYEAAVEGLSYQLVSPWFVQQTSPDQPDRNVLLHGMCRPPAGAVLP